MRLVRLLLASICAVLFLSENANSYRILGIFPHVARSHYIMGDSLMRGLAARGHDVTFITPYKPSESIKNYRVIHLERTLSDAEGGLLGISRRMGAKFLRLYSEKWNLAPREIPTLECFLSVLYDWNVNFTKSAMKSVNFQQFMQDREKFDVVIYEIYVCDALIGLGHYFGAPVIGFSTLRSSKWTSDLTGLSDFASHNPNYYNGFTDRMTFWQRMYNSLSYWYEDLTMHLHYYPTQQKLFDELFRNEPDMPTYSALRRNISLVFVNSHVSFGIPQPMPPNLVEIGGIHVKTIVEPLTDDVQTFLDGAVNGAIYFSLGSTVELAKLPQQQKQMIANAFGEFPNHRFLIKCTEEFAMPAHDQSNVLIRQWFNQEAILSHPNVKVFITHGGLLSTTEAVHFGKPVIGISVFFDQSFNMKLAQQMGYGIHIPYGDLSEQNLKSAIEQMLTNTSYSETVRKISERFHDQINTPMDRAVHWVEHVARHKGSLYMQSWGVQLPFHVYYNLDVWTFIVLGVVIIGCVVLKVVRKICCANGKRSSDKQKLN